MKGEFAQVMEVVLSGGKWTPDRIKEARPSITLSCETIGHNLRRARRAGRVDVSYYVSGRGQKVAEYFAPQAQAGYCARLPLQQQGPATLTVTPGPGATLNIKTGQLTPVAQMFFFSTPASKEPSPYFQSLAWAKAKAELVGAKNARFWTGTHEAPIPVEEQGAA